MTLKPIAICISLACVAGCQPDAQDSQSASTASVVTQANQGNDLTNKQTVNIDFPVYVDDKVPTLLHPIMATQAKTNSAYSFSKKSGKNQSYFGAAGSFHYQTHIQNLAFEKIDSGEIQTLFDHNKFVIQDVYYPHVIEESNTVVKQVQHPDRTGEANVVAKEPKVTLFDRVIFHVLEHKKPADKESKSNLHQQRSLYMTNHLGKNRIKLHPDNEYVQQTKWLPDVARYYFVTRVDSDNNGIINTKDTRKNYVIDFKKDNPTAIAYDFDNAK